MMTVVQFRRFSNLSTMIAIDQLKSGRNISWENTQHNMKPRISVGDVITIRAVRTLDEILQDDLILCKPDKHVVLGVVGEKRSDRVRVNDVGGKKLGWATLSHIYGKARQ